MPELFRLLLVEDNPDDTFLFMMAVRRYALRFEIAVAGDGKEAKEALLEGAVEQVVPHLVVTDVNMPRWNGFDLVRWMRADLRFAPIPVCFLTSSVEPEDVGRAYKAGANLYLVKPPGIRGYDELLRVIREFRENPTARPQSPLVRLRNDAVGRQLRTQIAH